MNLTVLCHGCGHEVPVPEGHGRPKVRCPGCAAWCDVSIQVDDEDDGKPYALPADPQTTPCPKCKKNLPSDAIVCAGCGYNQETGEVHERHFQEVDKQWDAGLRFPIRLRIFLAVAGLALTTTIIVGVVDGGWIALLVSFLIGVALLAYVLGTYSRINLVRNWRGRVRLTRTWRICFYPLSATEIRWRGYERVSAGLSREADFWDWGIFLVLLPWGLIPGVVWWLFMIQPGQFEAALCKGHGFPALVLYHGPSEAIAKEIATTIGAITGLPHGTRA